MSEEYQLGILDLLGEIRDILKEMKQQEFEYWEAWKKAKEKENA